MYKKRKWYTVNYRVCKIYHISYPRPLRLHYILYVISVESRINGEGGSSPQSGDSAVASSSLSACLPANITPSITLIPIKQVSNIGLFYFNRVYSLSESATVLTHFHFLYFQELLYICNLAGCRYVWLGFYPIWSWYDHDLDSSLFRQQLNPCKQTGYDLWPYRIRRGVLIY